VTLIKEFKGLNVVSIMYPCSCDVLNSCLTSHTTKLTRN